MDTQHTYTNRVMREEETAVSWILLALCQVSGFFIDQSEEISQVWLMDSIKKKHDIRFSQ